MLRLTFVQAFNAMRVFLSMYYEKTRTDVIGTMCGSLNLFKDKPIFYDEFLWKEVDILLISIKSSEHVDSDLVWQEWIKAINHTVNETYELDVYFDPFTGERMS